MNVNEYPGVILKKILDLISKIKKIYMICTPEFKTNLDEILLKLKRYILSSELAMSSCDITILCPLL